jgi:outer membrane biosynthesis protein TonB
MLHVGVFGGFALFAADARPMADAKIIPVEILTLAEETNVSAAVKAPKPTPKPDPEIPEIMTTPTPMENAPEVDDVVETAPTPPPVEKVAEVLPEPELKEDVIPVPEPEPTPEPEEPSFDLDALSGLIDKTRETAPEVNQQVALESETAITRYEDAARRAVGEGSGMSATETDMLVAAMQKCWRMPAAAKDAENLLVRLRVNFVPGGQVESVKLIDQAASRKLSPGNPFWEQAEREAIAAVHKCAPYDFLPDERFAVWRELVLNLRPEL